MTAKHKDRGSAHVDAKPERWRGNLVAGACEHEGMRVTFPRLQDGSRAYSIVDQADGVRYRIHEGIAGADIPHDLVHFIVERETGEDGGFWGAVAAGAVVGSMEHVAGRRPPHARDRSTANGAETTCWALPHHVTSVSLQRVNATESQITAAQLASIRQRITLAVGMA